jgi:OOP family OmpA-OmpF porin
MKKILTSLLFIACVQSTFAQSTNIRPAAIGVSFFVNDFKTPQRIRNSTLSQVLRDKQFAKISESAPGLALTYFQGLHKYIDFAGTLAGSFVNFPASDQTFASDAFLLEADGSVNLKLLPENYLFTPYLNVGVGISHYRSYTGAFLPLGAGFKFNLFNEAAIFISSQYRVPITSQTSAYHFMHSIGISGVIGNKKGM